MYISISNAKLPSFTHKWHTTNVLFCHPWNKTNLMLNLNCKRTVHIYTFTLLCFSWKTISIVENLLGVTKSNLFNLGMDILFSQFIHVSFFVVTCMRHFKNAKKSRASLISQSLVGSLLIIYTEDSLYIVPCIFFLSSITVPQASARLDMS